MNWGFSRSRTNRLQPRGTPGRFEQLESRLALDVAAVADAFTVGRDQVLEPSERITLVPAGATWQYFSPCMPDLDPAIADPDFYETWHSQLAEPGIYDGPAFQPAPIPIGYFGFSDTTIRFVTPRCVSVATVTFLTRTFEFTGDPSHVADLWAEVLVDDGAIVYLNGQEAGRVRMDGKSDRFGQHASANYPEASGYAPVPLNGALVAGTNTIAVSFYNYAPISDDYEFDIRLRARTRVASVLDNDLGDAGGLVLAAVQGISLDGSTATVGTDYGSLTIDRRGVFSYTPQPNFVGEDHFTYEVRDASGDSASTVVEIQVTSPDDRFATRVNETLSMVDIVPLVDRSATWNYFIRQGGVDPTAADPDFYSTWFTQSSAAEGYDGPVFDAAGPAPFAYGPVACCTAATTLDVVPQGDSRHAVYFVRDFGFDRAWTPRSLLVADILFDDGVFLYLNGQEFGRLNVRLTDGASARGDATVVAALYRRYYFPTSLELGSNALAVSLHQASIGNDDAAFAMELNARRVLGSVLDNDAFSSLAVGVAPIVDRVQGRIISQLAREQWPQYGTAVATPHGEVDMWIQGEFVYTPAEGFYGLDQFTYVASADGIALPPATVTIHVSPDPGLLSCTAFDLDDSGTVDLGDVAALTARFGESVPVGSSGDIDYDGRVALADAVLLRNRLGEWCVSELPPAAAALVRSVRTPDADQTDARIRILDRAIDEWVPLRTDRGLSRATERVGAIHTSENDIDTASAPSGLTARRRRAAIPESTAIGHDDGRSLRDMLTERFGRKLRGP